MSKLWRRDKLGRRRKCVINNTRRNVLLMKDTGRVAENVSIQRGLCLQPLLRGTNAMAKFHREKATNGMWSRYRTARNCRHRIRRIIGWTGRQEGLLGIPTTEETRRGQHFLTWSAEDKWYPAAPIKNMLHNQVRLGRQENGLVQWNHRLVQWHHQHAHN